MAAAADLLGVYCDSVLVQGHDLDLSSGLYSLAAKALPSATASQLGKVRMHAQVKDRVESTASKDWKFDVESRGPSVSRRQTPGGRSQRPSTQMANINWNQN